MTSTCLDKTYISTYCLFPLEDRVLILRWRTTSTSSPSSLEEVSSEVYSSEDSYSHEKSERSEKSSSLNKILPIKKTD
jgi:hypothetical protein